MVNMPTYYNYNQEDVLHAIREHQNNCPYCMFRRYFEFYRNIPLEDRRRYLLIPDHEMQQMEIIYQDSYFRSTNEEILEAQNYEEFIDR